MVILIGYVINFQFADDRVCNEIIKLCDKETSKKKKLKNQQP